MNLQEKLRLAHQLEVLGVDIMEAGFPASSPGDFESVQRIAAQAGDIQVAGLARCVAGDIDRCWDAIKVAKNPRIHIFLSTSPLHMQHKLRKKPADHRSDEVADPPHRRHERDGPLPQIRRQHLPSRPQTR